MRIFGLTFGGRIRRDLAARSIAVPLLSLHIPGRMCWSWGIDFYRSRRESGEVHRFFRVIHIPGHQARTILDLFWLGSIQFIRQKRTEQDRLLDERRSFSRS